MGPLCGRAISSRTACAASHFGSRLLSECLLWNTCVMHRLAFLLSFLLAVFVGRADVTILSEKFFFGACDASAGVALTDDLFAAADDESNHLRVYSISGNGAPLFDLS